jgi:hypothetical protein
MTEAIAIVLSINYGLGWLFVLMALALGVADESNRRGTVAIMVFGAALFLVALLLPNRAPDRTDEPEK